MRFELLYLMGFIVIFFRNIDCFWIIKARESSDVIKLKVLDSELEGSYTCSFDRDIVTIYDGKNITLLKRFQYLNIVIIVRPLTNSL